MRSQAEVDKYFNRRGTPLATTGGRVFKNPLTPVLSGTPLQRAGSSGLSRVRSAPCQGDHLHPPDNMCPFFSAQPSFIIYILHFVTNNITDNVGSYQHPREIMCPFFSAQPSSII